MVNCPLIPILSFTFFFWLPLASSKISFCPNLTKRIHAETFLLASDLSSLSAGASKLFIEMADNYHFWWPFILLCEFGNRLLSLSTLFHKIPLDIVSVECGFLAFINSISTFGPGRNSQSENCSNQTSWIERAIKRFLFRAASPTCQTNCAPMIRSFLLLVQWGVVEQETPEQAVTKWAFWRRGTCGRLLEGVKWRCQQWK